MKPSYSAVAQPAIRLLTPHSFNRTAPGGNAPADNLMPEKFMPNSKDTAKTADLPYQPIPFAKKHRISVEDAKAIIEKHGADRKSADKEARRVSV